MPSSREVALGCEAKPASWRTGNRKSPEPSPVKGRPVRLEPCAPGASPKRQHARVARRRRRERACPSTPNRRRRGWRTRATSAQYSRSRGQRSQATICAFRA